MSLRDKTGCILIITAHSASYLLSPKQLLRINS